MGLNRSILIIWPNCRPSEHIIKELLANECQILQKYEITWSEKLIDENYSRLLGRKVSSKEINTLGRGAFLLYILNTSFINRNLLISLKKIGCWFYDGKEANRAVTLLLGQNIEDTLKCKTKQESTIVLKQDLAGAIGWNSIGQLFYVMNNSISYCILRNAEDISRDFSPTIHGDIDFLVEDRLQAEQIINGTRVNPEKWAYSYIVSVANRRILMDMQYIGDNYYCEKWETKMLKDSREIQQNGVRIHVMTPQCQYYALLYHAFLQKEVISSGYMMKIQMWANRAGEPFRNDAIFLIRQLLDFMKMNNYSYVLPRKISTYINWNNLKYFKEYKRILFLYKVEPVRVMRRIMSFKNKFIHKVSRIIHLTYNIA